MFSYAYLNKFQIINTQNQWQYKILQNKTFETYFLVIPKK